MSLEGEDTIQLFTVGFLYGLGVEILDTYNEINFFFFFVETSMLIPKTLFL